MRGCDCELDSVCVCVCLCVECAKMFHDGFCWVFFCGPAGCLCLETGSCVWVLLKDFAGRCPCGNCEI